MARMTMRSGVPAGDSNLNTPTYSKPFRTVAKICMTGTIELNDTEEMFVFVDSCKTLDCSINLYIVRIWGEIKGNNSLLFQGGINSMTIHII